MKCNKSLSQKPGTSRSHLNRLHNQILSKHNTTERKTHFSTLLTTRNVSSHVLTKSLSDAFPRCSALNTWDKLTHATWKYSGDIEDINPVILILVKKMSSYSTSTMTQTAKTRLFLVQYITWRCHWFVNTDVTKVEKHSETSSTCISYSNIPWLPVWTISGSCRVKSNLWTREIKEALGMQGAGGCV